MMSLALFSQLTYAQEPDWTWHNPLPQGNSLAGVWDSSGSDVLANDVFTGGAGGTILHHSAGGDIFLPLVTKDFAP